MISHDMDFLAENLDRFVLIQRGRIILDAPAQDFFAQKVVLEACGVISPQIARLSCNLNRSRIALSVEKFLKGSAIESKSPKIFAPYYKSTTHSALTTQTFLLIRAPSSRFMQLIDLHIPLR